MLIIIYTLVTIHLGCALGSLYMHRYAIHRQYEMAPGVEKTMRVMYWILFDSVSSQFIAQHRKHHALSDGPHDPHSPRFGFWSLLKSCSIPPFFRPYTIKMTDQECLAYGVQPSIDFTDRHPRLGVLLLLAVNITIFGWFGIVSWTVHLFAVNFLIITVITVFGHSFGYRNFDLGDMTKNICPIGILAVGEELHNNHHKDSRRCNFAAKPNEFDLGFFYLGILARLKLISIKGESDV